MVFGSFLKKTLVVSLIGHITAFGIFSFSFGPKFADTNFANVYFWGAILPNSGTMNKIYIKGRRIINASSTELLLTRAKTKEDIPIGQYYLKPMVVLSPVEDKAFFSPPLTAASLSYTKSKPPVLLYPRLPYHFLLFFKDRQAVHVELMFNISTSGKRSRVVTKRRISSGNLEADLLTMRYVGHYLFIEQARFPLDTWQTVRIDLGAKND